MGDDNTNPTASPQHTALSNQIEGTMRKAMLDLMRG